MILTLTPNPSLDRTVELQGPLRPGGVHRIGADRVQLGGKGINVALGLAQADVETLAVLPADSEDPFLGLLRASGLPHRTSPVAGTIRTNLTVLSSPSTTTKLNEPGATVTAEEIADLEAALLEAAARAEGVMLSGSLAPGMREDWYGSLVRSLHALGVWVGVDTSDGPLTALSAAWREEPAAAPELLKPNAEELGQLLGLDGEALERAAHAGDLGPVRDAARSLREQGIGEVLVTLGGAGAVLATEQGCWYSETAAGEVVSTVGAGDSATAGYLIARDRHQGPAERLALAVAYGTAAVGLPGTTIPRPDQVLARPQAVRAV